jgi:hypothetical protein
MDVWKRDRRDRQQAKHRCVDRELESESTALLTDGTHSISLLNAGVDAGMEA